MLTIAYAVSPFLTRYLERIELLRQQIILLPLSPKRELGWQFQTTIERVHAGLLLTDQQLKSETIKTILSNQIVFATQKDTHNYDKIQNTILQYKQGLDYIKRDWLLNDQTVNGKTLQKLYSFTAGDEALPFSEKNLQETLQYLQSTTDNPFIQSAIAKLQFRRLLPESPQAELFSTLCAYLFLYRGGMDCRSMIILEKPWVADKRIYLGYYQTALAKPNITGWLEFYVKMVCSQLEETLETLSKTTNHQEQDKVGKVNERQKAIITLLEDPQAIITNRTVQKIFHVSQITASRDLAKLTMLGLLFTHGKGRSVRYTRI
jgi:hypothetical protein